MTGHTQNPVEIFNDLYERFFPMVRAWFSRSFMPEEAEDLAQQTFMQLWGWLPCCAEIRSEKALVFRIARNVRADRLRQKSILAEAVQLMEETDLTDRSDFTTGIDLETVLYRLPRADRELIEMRRLGWSSREIGRAVGLSASAVRTRLQALRKKVGSLLEL